MKKRGSLLVETMIALAVFTITAAEVSKAFLLGLKARQLGTCDEDRVVMTTTLINQLKLEGVDEHVVQNNTLSLKTGKDTEVWHLRVDPNNIKKLDPIKAETCSGNADHEGLYKLAIEVWNDQDENTTSPTDGTYSERFDIFHYFSKTAAPSEKDVKSLKNS